MKWSHLPRSGLLKDQDIDLLDKWRIIWSERSIAQEEERKDRERKSKAGNQGGVRRPRGRGR